MSGKAMWPDTYTQRYFYLNPGLITNFNMHVTSRETIIKGPSLKHNISAVNQY
jgi:hypothetical protein